MYFLLSDCSSDPSRKDGGSVPVYLPDCAVTWATVEVLRTLCSDCLLLGTPRTCADHRRVCLQQIEDKLSLQMRKTVT